MLDALVNIAVRLIGQFVVHRILIRVDRAGWQYPLMDNREDRFGFYVRGHHSDHTSAALTHPEYRSLWRVRAGASTVNALVVMLELVLAAYVHLVQFNRFALQADVLRHQGANLLEHPPGRFVRDARF